MRFLEWLLLRLFSIRAEPAHQDVFMAPWIIKKQESDTDRAESELQAYLAKEREENLARHQRWHGFLKPGNSYCTDVTPDPGNPGCGFFHLHTVSPEEAYRNNWDNIFGPPRSLPPAAPACKHIWSDGASSILSDRQANPYCALCGDDL